MRKAICFITSIILFTSCKKELAPQESSIDFSKVQSTNQGTNQTSQSNNSSFLNQNNATVTKTNPPHGQPGHVCGNATTQTQTAQSANQQFTVTPNATSTINNTPAKVAKGMNPPHGQPGHRCDIAVGAPLNSKPKKPTTTTTINTNNNIPSLVSTNASTTQVASGMNPPHGQPGHRCDIAVGSPLNQEKKAEEVKVKTEETKTEEIKKEN